uniref:Uncharacterized protein n=1 Tax=Rhizophora mucronata TaxID=61149 RepID=A0A2P2MTQ7_RHIMU
MVSHTKTKIHMLHTRLCFLAFSLHGKNPHSSLNHGIKRPPLPKNRLPLCKHNCSLK